LANLPDTPAQVETNTTTRYRPRNRKESKIMSLKVIQPSTMAKPATLSPGIRAGDFVFVSGQASVDETGKIVSDTFENEFRRTIANVKKVLEAAGMNLTHIVQVKAYVKDPNDVAEYNRLYKEVFKEPLPARTTITRCLEPVKFEMDVVAYDGK
jgi:2-iminobutanoate/2-iminopropanoate deaminase